MCGCAMDHPGIECHGEGCHCHDDELAPDPLETDLTLLLNRYSQENKSGTPDYILAWYLLACLEVWNTATVMRGNWRGETVEETQGLGKDVTDGV